MMNPFSWSREHQLALIVAAFVGAALATVLGYIVYALGWGEGALSFENWILRLLRGPIWWALFGAVIGGASIFVRKLMRERSALTPMSPSFETAEPSKIRLKTGLLYCPARPLDAVKVPLHPHCRRLKVGQKKTWWYAFDRITDRCSTAELIRPLIGISPLVTIRDPDFRFGRFRVCVLG
jgi:hypothetical protein